MPTLYYYLHWVKFFTYFKWIGWKQPSNIKMLFGMFYTQVEISCLGLRQSYYLIWSFPTWAFFRSLVIKFFLFFLLVTRIAKLSCFLIWKTVQKTFWTASLYCYCISSNIEANLKRKLGCLFLDLITKLFYSRMLF